MKTHNLFQFKPLGRRGRGFLWTFAGNATYQVCQWAAIVFLAKTFGPEMAGRYALGVALCAPIFMFSNLQLRVVQATDARDEYSFANFFLLRVTTTALSMLAVWFVTLLWDDAGPFRGVIVLVAAGRAVDSLSDIIYGLLQKGERLDRVGASLAMKGPLYLAGVAVGTLMTRGNLAAGVAAGTLLSSVVTVAFDWPGAAAELRRSRAIPASVDHNRRTSKQATKTLGLFRSTITLGFATLLSSLMANIPRYALQGHFGEGALGFFAGMAYLVTAGNNFIGSLTQATIAEQSREYQDNPSAFGRLVNRVALAAVLVGLVGLLLAATMGSGLLAVLYTPAYGQHAQVLVWLMAVGTVDYLATPYISAMIVTRQFRLQLAVLAISVLATYIGSILLVPRYGLLGATWALGLGEVGRLAGGVVGYWRATVTPDSVVHTPVA